MKAPAAGAQTTTAPTAKTPTAPAPAAPKGRTAAPGASTPKAGAGQAAKSGVGAFDFMLPTDSSVAGLPYDGVKKRGDETGVGRR